MTSTPVRPAAPEDADELLRLRVAVLGGEPVTTRGGPRSATTCAPGSGPIRTC